MRQRILVALVLLALPTGCGLSASRRCRMGNAFERNDVRYAVNEAHCEQLADYEREDELTERARAERQEAAVAAEQQRAEQQAQADEQERVEAVRAVLRAPRAPEVGSTINEAVVICGNELGTVARAEASLSCSVGSNTIFDVVYDLNQLASLVDVYYQGADLDVVRGTFVDLFHRSWDGVVVNDEGFRIFWWFTPGNDHSGLAGVSMTSSGARVRFLLLEREVQVQTAIPQDRLLQL